MNSEKLPLAARTAKRRIISNRNTGSKIDLINNMRDFDADIGLWVKLRRKELDLTQAALGDQVGCSAEYIRKIEQGTRHPSKDIALRLADALRLPPEQRDGFISALRSLPDREQPVSNLLRLSTLPLRVPVKLIGRS